MMNNSPIRVAQIMGKMNGGGAEAVVMNYYKNIDRDVVQFDFIVDSDSMCVPSDEITALGGRIFSVPPYKRVAKYETALYTLFQSHSWAIAHSHINSLSLFPLMAAKRAGVPIRIAHSHSTWGQGEIARNVLKAALRRGSHRYANYGLACSVKAGDWLFGDRLKYELIRNAVDFDDYVFSQERRERVRKELGLSKSTFVVGHIGRFQKQKNHERLIRIFQKVKAIRPDAVLLLAGDGPLKARIEELATSLDLLPNVLFLGQRSDANELYSAFDCFCLPSLYEGLPLVGVEAQISGLHTIFSDEVTDEALLTDRAISLPLEMSDESWAQILCDCDRSGRELSVSELSALQSYNILTAAAELQHFYQNALKGL